MVNELDNLEETLFMSPGLEKQISFDVPKDNSQSDVKVCLQASYDNFKASLISFEMNDKMFSATMRIDEQGLSWPLRGPEISDVMIFKHGETLHQRRLEKHWRQTWALSQDQAGWVVRFKVEERKDEV